MKNPVDQPLEQQKHHVSFYAVFVMILCAAFLLYKYVVQVSPSVMANDIMQAFNISGLGLGNLAAIFFYSYVFMQLFVGVLIDRYGTRILASVAILACALGTYLFSQSQVLIHAELSRALMGAGVAFATVSYMKMAAVWFPARYFGLIAGLAATAAMIGAVLGQSPLATLVESFGWREALYICAAVGVVLAVLFFLIVRNKPRGYIEKQAGPKVEGSFKREIIGVLKNKTNWLLTLYNSLIFAPVAVFAGLWGTPFMMEGYQLIKQDAAFLVSFSFIGLAIGTPLAGFLAERFSGGRRLIMTLSPLLGCLFISLVIYIQLPYGLAATCLFLFGFSLGAFILCFAIGRDLNHAALVATFAALINSGDAISSAVSETLVGKFLDLTWTGAVVDGVHHFTVDGYRKAFLLIPAYLITSALLMIFIKDVESKED